MTLKKDSYSRNLKGSIKKWLILFLILIFPYMIVRYVEAATHNILTLGYLENKQGTVLIDSVRVPEFQLINQDEKYVSNKDLLGNNYIINFFYRTSENCEDHKCILINDVVVNLRELQNKISLDNKIDNFKIISISLDPDYPSHDIKKYAMSMNVDLSNWDFLTGSKNDVYNIINSGLLFPKYVDSVAVNGVSTGTGYYSSNITIVDDKGYVRTGLDKKKKLKDIYDSTSFTEVKLLIGEIQRLSNKDYQDDHDIKKK